MIIRNETPTSTTILKVEESSIPIWNQSASITIGGRPKSSADSQRLRIDLDFVVSEAELITLNGIIESFSSRIFYTPSNKLFGRATIAEIEVIVTEPANAYDKGNDASGNLVYFCKMTLEEVKA
jgi:hypothetical protein